MGAGSDAVGAAGAAESDEAVGGRAPDDTCDE